MKTITLLFISIIALLLATPTPACHHDKEGAQASDVEDHSAHMEMAKATQPDDGMNVGVELSDLELLDHNGRPLRLASDVIGDKLVAMTFVYTECTTICPIYSALFSQIQELLGERMEREVVLVTLTLDPTTDVPLRLQREAKKYGAQPGWYYLTGDQNNVNEVLRGLDAYFPDFTQHPPMALIGDGRTGTWKRFNGFPQPEQIVSLLDELKAARDAA